MFLAVIEAENLNLMKLAWPQISRETSTDPRNIASIKMDPISITAAVSSLVFTLVKTGKQLHIIFEFFQEAQHSLFMIQTECTVLTAALSLIQVLFAGKESKRGTEVPRIVIDALESSLLGCTMILSVLTKEISGIVRDIEISQTLKRKQQAKYVWKQEKMSNFVQQLRGQSMALSLLLKALDSSSVDRILQILESNRKVFDAAEDDAATIRASMPERNFPESIAELSMTDGESLYDLLLDNEDEDQADTPTIFEDEKYANASIARRPRNSATASSSAAHSQPSITCRPLALRPARDVSATATLRHLVISQRDLGPKLESFLQKFQNNIPAVGVALLDGKKASICSKGVRKHGEPTLVVDSDIWVMPPSIYPTLIPLALSRLIDRGLLSWSDTIDDLLPNIANRLDSSHQGTTLEMVCLHTVDDYTGIWTNSRKEQHNYVTKLNEMSYTQAQTEVVLSHFGQRKLSNQKDSIYNFVNYIAVILIMETVTGRKFSEILNSEVFSPLGMVDIRWGGVENIDHGTRQLVWPHSASSGFLVPELSSVNVQSPYGALVMKEFYGILCCTLTDLCKLLSGVLHNRALPNIDQTETFLSAGIFEKLVQTKVLTQEYSQLHVNLGGYCSVTETTASGKKVPRLDLASGYTELSSISITFYPSVGKAFLWLTNSDGSEKGTSIAASNELNNIWDQYLNI